MSAGSAESKCMYCIKPVLIRFLSVFRSVRGVNQSRGGDSCWGGRYRWWVRSKANEKRKRDRVGRDTTAKRSKFCEKSITSSPKLRIRSRRYQKELHTFLVTLFLSDISTTTLGVYLPQPRSTRIKRVVLEQARLASY